MAAERKGNAEETTWALGDKPPLRAWGMGGRQVCTDPLYGDQYDHQAVIFEYPNGVRVFGFTRDIPDCFNETSDFVMGTKGRANLIKHQIEGETRWQFEGDKENMYNVEHQELFDSIRLGKPINNSNYMGLSTLLAIVAQMACYSGQVIEWDAAMKSKRVLTPPNVGFNSTPPIVPDKNGIYPTPMPGKEEFARWIGKS